MFEAIHTVLQFPSYKQTAGVNARIKLLAKWQYGNGVTEICTKVRCDRRSKYVMRLFVSHVLEAHVIQLFQ